MELAPTRALRYLRLELCPTSGEGLPKGALPDLAHGRQVHMAPQQLVHAGQALHRHLAPMSNYLKSEGQLRSM